MSALTLSPASSSSSLVVVVVAVAGGGGGPGWSCSLGGSLEAEEAGGGGGVVMATVVWLRGKEGAPSVLEARAVAEEANVAALRFGASPVAAAVAAAAPDDDDEEDDEEEEEDPPGTLMERGRAACDTATLCLVNSLPDDIARRS